MSIYDEQPPAGVTDAVWRIPVEGPITYTLFSPTNQKTNEAIMDDFIASAAAWIEPETRTVACPECEADQNLIAEGNWRGPQPMRLTCPNGHSWTPLPEDPEFGRGLMRRLILAATPA